jgi:antitoxin (DNA-binding transcriptional repressor) of toxin-antitoxin stability system
LPGPGILGHHLAAAAEDVAGSGLDPKGGIVGVAAIDLASAPSLRDLVEEASRTGEVLLTDGGEAVARIIPLRRVRTARQPGSARGLIHMADDFDATPEDFSAMESIHTDNRS